MVIIEWSTLLLLACVAFGAGFIDTLAGGGGLITLPALILAQVPPLSAIATNKLQSTFGSLSSTLTLWRLRKIRIKIIYRGFCYSFAGAIIGALCVQLITPKALSFIIPVVLIVIATYFLFSIKSNKVRRHYRWQAKWYHRIIIPLIGFYDGFLGPGTGSLFSLAEVSLRGRNLVQATAHAKAFNFASNIASLCIFIASGKIIWLIGFCMLIGQVLGAYLGAHAMLKGGAKIIRPLIVIVCLVMLIKYILP